MNAPLKASSLPNAPTIRAHCSDCHARDGRDLNTLPSPTHRLSPDPAFMGCRSARPADRQLYPFAARPQSRAPMESSVSARTRSGRATGRQLGGRSRAVMGARQRQRHASIHLRAERFWQGRQPGMALRTRRTGCDPPAHQAHGFSSRWKPECARDPDLPATPGLEPLAPARASSGRVGPGFQNSEFSHVWLSSAVRSSLYGMRWRRQISRADLVRPHRHKFRQMDERAPRASQAVRRGSSELVARFGAEGVFHRALAAREDLGDVRGVWP